ncbi:alanine racemase [Sphingomonas sp. SFZ2018-12]|uniref:alanine racemase n=1 Tax=Sphingomonas sp. SFZ2018-12 TaxID=2683197 RepID=UPI001F0EC7EE|nr:alanine racemase [Sphingomonas sp. SFZ2018-12]MCH4891789.1 alanine racemase [Sphingomonas sp. SFZ2018-12]
MIDPTPPPAAPLRLMLDGAALWDNWRALARMSGAAVCGAAVKADGYGLGARAVMTRLAAAGCRDFYVATWAEALAVADLGLDVAVLHGVRADDLAVAMAAPAHLRPVLNSVDQVARWRDAGGRRCDVMIDTGMNRLGLSPAEAGSGALTGLTIDTLMSHLACADAPDDAMNARQRDAFAAMAAGVPARRRSLANSAGVALGVDYQFDLTRPGLAIYGGVPVAALADALRPVVGIAAQVLQCRDIAAGDAVGYNATFTAAQPMRLATLNLGYADGYWRGFSGVGRARIGGDVRAVLGRVSMDLTIVDVTGLDVREGDWIAVDYALPEAAAASGMSQYELLTGLGRRFERVWC